MHPEQLVQFLGQLELPVWFVDSRMLYSREVAVVRVAEEEEGEVAAEVDGSPWSWLLWMLLLWFIGWAWGMRHQESTTTGARTDSRNSGFLDELIKNMREDKQRSPIFGKCLDFANPNDPKNARMTDKSPNEIILPYDYHVVQATPPVRTNRQEEASAICYADRLESAVSWGGCLRRQASLGETRQFTRPASPTPSDVTLCAQFMETFNVRADKVLSSFWLDVGSSEPSICKNMRFFVQRRKFLWTFMFDSWMQSCRTIVANAVLRCKAKIVL